VVAAQMVKGGFRVELISQEWALFWDKQGVKGGKLPFYYIGRGGLIDADTLYDQYFRTGTTRRTNYSNADLDKLVEEQQKTPESKKRIALLQRAGKYIMDEALFHTALQSRRYLWHGEKFGLEIPSRRSA
jgi:peptide/nickel transport system substrate-binding protein